MGGGEVGTVPLPKQSGAADMEGQFSFFLALANALNLSVKEKIFAGLGPIRSKNDSSMIHCEG